MKSAEGPRPVDHYENFPVASWLCPPRLRPPIAAIYWFARTADDIADEGDAPAPQRLDELDAYRRDLENVLAGQPPSPTWSGVFLPLAAAIESHALPAAPLRDLLGAFEQDVRKTRAGGGYEDRTELLDYCRRSANPVGRLLLHLYGVQGAQDLERSDAICTALQLINFWQDLGTDLARGRIYLPRTLLQAHGLDPDHPGTWATDPQRLKVVQSLCHWARELMMEGAPLVHRVPGRAGWELRLIVQGGLRILDKIEKIGFDTFAHRPRLHPWDAPLLLGRALRM